MKNVIWTVSAASAYTLAGHDFPTKDIDWCSEDDTHGAIITVVGATDEDAEQLAALVVRLLNETDPG